MWWTKWHWERFLSKYFGNSPVSIIPPVPYTHSFICHRGYTNLANDSELLSKRIYCCVLRITSIAQIHENCLVPEASVLHTASVLTAKTLVGRHAQYNPVVCFIWRNKSCGAVSGSLLYTVQFPGILGHILVKENLGFGETYCIHLHGSATRENKIMSKL